MIAEKGTVSINPAEVIFSQIFAYAIPAIELAVFFRQLYVFHMFAAKPAFGTVQATSPSFFTCHLPFRISETCTF